MGSLSCRLGWHRWKRFDPKLPTIPDGCMDLVEPECIRCSRCGQYQAPNLGSVLAQIEGFRLRSISRERERRCREEFPDPMIVMMEKVLARSTEVRHEH